MFLIIENDKGLETFVTIINQTMTKPSLFVRNSDDSEPYETFYFCADIPRYKRCNKLFYRQNHNRGYYF